MAPKTTAPVALPRRPTTTAAATVAAADTTVVFTNRRSRCTCADVMTADTEDEMAASPRAQAARRFISSTISSTGVLKRPPPPALETPSSLYVCPLQVVTLIREAPVRLMGTTD